MSIPALLEEDLETPIYFSDIVQTDTTVEQDIFAQLDLTAKPDTIVQHGAIVQPIRVGKPLLDNSGKCRRHIGPQARKALKKLSHIHDYVYDEFVFEGGPFYSNNARVEAIQIVAALHSQIFFECPEVPTFVERVKTRFLRLKGKLFGAFQKLPRCVTRISTPLNGN
jgi:hypothetical protein